MKSKNTILLVLIFSIVIGSIFISLNGIKIGKYEIPKIKDAIDLGLDLAGGVYVVLEAQTNAKGIELQKIMEQTKVIIDERVNSLGVSEPNITIEGSNRIRVELAGIDDPQKAIELIGKTAQLQFIDPNKNIVLTGKNVVGSEVQYHENQLGQQEIVVSLELDKEGTKNFAEATGRLTLEKNIEDRIIYIVLDDQIISYPAVQSAEEGGTAITDGKAVITGSFTLEEASELAALIRAGALPVEMKELQTSIIGPTLGLEAYEKSLKAVGIALIIIMVFMVIIYRIPGLIASIGLIIYTLITVFTMSALEVKLTLPGIAGLILSIGMAVDANVIIFERIKEEIKVGKTLRTAVDAGFRRALTSVMDSNITTLIAGVVLYYFGIGPIKGFGVTLIIGIIASMLTAVIISKYLLKLMVSVTGGKNTKLYGANSEVKR
ncbi:protein translocase subunit SecD [Tissierella pigra]|uniref:Protein translocase subunit SecD n=1 Tax=Tissierella pigra TaxID=2607614 RepID=A0A6N7XJQ1_9FIRM|nr:protein translocase subunit SecD [Tissierella pigra]MSU02311.1 protein translocase subunit SecD [Tissierella pigra]